MVYLFDLNYLTGLPKLAREAECTSRKNIAFSFLFFFLPVRFKFIEFLIIYCVIQKGAKLEMTWLIS